jgi:hypothetical protein
MKELFRELLDQPTKALLPCGSAALAVIFEHFLEQAIFL